MRTYEVTTSLNGDLFAEGWWVERVDYCTCDPWEGMYHPYCGLEPLVKCLPVIEGVTK